MTHPTGAREALEMCINLLPACECQEDPDGSVKFCESCYVSDKAHAALREINEAQGAQTGAPGENCGFCCEQDDVGENGKCRCGCHEDPRRTALLVCVAALKKVRLKIANWEKEYDEALKMAISALAAQGAGGMPQGPNGWNIKGTATDTRTFPLPEKGTQFTVEAIKEGEGT